MANILIVDDERPVIQYVRKILTSFGYSVDFVIQSELLFPKLEKDSFDLILLDVYLPGIDGLIRLKQLKAHPLYDSIPVIMLTGLVDDQLLANCFEAGAADFITKPINTLVLKARIGSALATQSLIQEMQAQQKDLEERTVQLTQANKQLQQEISKRQQIEEELRQYREQLEELVQIRTSELTEANEHLLQEIAQRKRMEHNLREAEERYRTLFEQSPDAILVVDPETTRPIEFNEIMPRMLGYSRQEFARLRVADFEANENPEEIKAHAEKIIREGHDEFETKFRTKSGEIREVLAIVQRLELSGRIVFYNIVRDITEQKRAAATLQQSEENFRALAHNANDGIIIASAAGSIVYANERMAEMLGYQPAEMLDATVEALVHPDEREKMINRYPQRLARKPASWQYETALAHQDGQKVPVEVTAARTIWQGQPADMAIIRDITRRIQAEEALKKSKANLVEAQRIARLGSWEYDIHSAREQWSDETYRILGFAPHQFQVVHENFFNFVHPDDREFVRESVDTALAGVKPYDISYRIILPDNSERIVHSKAEIIVDEQGQPLRMIGTLQDITEQRQLEEALRESEQYLTTLHDSLANAVFTIKMPEREVEYVNHAACRIFGYSAEEMIGRTTRMFYPDDASFLTFGRKLQTTLAEGQSQLRLEQEMLRKEGGRFWVEITVTFIFTDGKLAKVISIVSDITERIQAEQKIKTSLHEKEVLLKEIHHRVKNNMQIISSLLDLQADSIQDQQIREIFRESQHRIKSMALIHERLYQSKDLARINVAEYVESLTGHLLRSYRTKASNITLQLDIAPLSLSIETAIPCGLIINELISNAFKHAFPNGRSGQIGIGLQAEDQQLALVVRDNGIGFPPQIDFRRATSLGLTLVMTLVRQIKGTIELQLETGTAFKIYFNDPTAKAND